MASWLLHHLVDRATSLRRQDLQACGCNLKPDGNLGGAQVISNSTPLCSF